MLCWYVYYGIPFSQISYHIYSVQGLHSDLRRMVLPVFLCHSIGNIGTVQICKPFCITHGTSDVYDIDPFMTLYILQVLIYR